MTLAPSLLEQRLALRGRLRDQRLEVAERLFEAKARDHFPRSTTMRVLMHQPELAARLLALIAGRRFAVSASALFVVVKTLRAARPHR